jgi:hypothetical protein
MKVFYLLLMALTIFQAQVWAQAQTTLIKSVGNEAKQPLVLSFQGQVEVAEWDQAYIRVTTWVQLENFDEGLLKKLVAAGRYNVQQDNQGPQLVLSMPKLEKIVRIQNQELKEVLRYQIQVPKGQHFEIKAPASASL